MSSEKNLLLVIVEGPSEVQEHGRDIRGIVPKILEHICGDDGWLKHVRTKYWAEVGRELKDVRKPRIELSRDRPDVFDGFARKTANVMRVARPEYSWGVIFLLDGDRNGEKRLRSLRLGASLEDEQDVGSHVAVGVAIEMVEAWLLADPKFTSSPGSPIPSGKAPETLWGKRSDRNSNFPKNVLKRCVLGPRRWSFSDAVEHWDVESACKHSPSLNRFVSAVRNLLSSHGGL